MKLHEAVKEFIAWKTFTVKKNAIGGYVNDLRQLSLFLHNPEIEDVRWEDILKLTEEMTELGWDTNSFVRKFISYRKFFEYWHKKNPNVMDHTWIPVKHMEYRTPRTIDEESYQKLLKAIPADKIENEILDRRNRAALNLLWDTGCRVGELVSIDRDRLDLVNQEVLIKTEKSRGKRPVRQLFWTKETNENLKEYLKLLDKLVKSKGYYDNNALFIILTGKHAGKRLRPTGISQMLGILSDRAKIPRFNAHSFRHHMGHDIIKKGGSNSDVSNILGHSSLDSSYIYTQMNGVELKQRYKEFKGN